MFKLPLRYKNGRSCENQNLHAAVLLFRDRLYNQRGTIQLVTELHFLANIFDISQNMYITIHGDECSMIECLMLNAQF